MPEEAGGVQTVQAGVGRYGGGEPGCSQPGGDSGGVQGQDLGAKGERPGPFQMGQEVSWIRRRLSMAAIKAANKCLLGMVSQVESFKVDVFMIKSKVLCRSVLDHLVNS